MTKNMGYKDTVHLPRTDFSMRANLPKKEIDILGFWDELDIYKEVRKSRSGKEKFVLHDGPPYTNGHIHLGQALNKILKDTIVKYKAMMGFDTPCILGWDCHGMPIEHEVIKTEARSENREAKDQKTEDIRRIEIIKKCRLYAEKFVHIQMAEFKRLGVFGDWANPYLTMDKSYEAKIIENFGAMLDKGYVYRGLRPIYWCFHCKTALSEHEVEYAECKSPSVYVKFTVKDTIADIPYQTNFIIWTTTPWTIPANVGIAVNPNYEYSFVLMNNEVYVVAKELVESIMSVIGFFEGSRGKGYKIIKTVKGVELENLHCQHPLGGRGLINQTSTVVLADWVGLEQGTGCVHIAPGHGYEDYQVGLKYKLPIISPVDESGKFTEEAGEFAGKQVFDADPYICNVLRDNGFLLYEGKILHSYPHCWRCRKPLIFRAAYQWFLAIDHNNLRNECLAEIENINWIPYWSKDRIKNMVEERPDWCLSRQRYWGVPIPAIYCKNCDSPILEKGIIKRAQTIIKNGGGEAWFTCDISDLVGSASGGKELTCQQCGKKEFRKGTDILDVWFDSSCSYSAVLKKSDDLKYPADLYLEGAEQARGWFQLSLIESLITDKKAPYKSVVSHGLILDSSMRKMSKSLGNVISTDKILKKYGADILRLQFLSVDYTQDFPFSEELFLPVIDSYRKIRNTFRFLLGNLYDFNPENKVSYNKLLEIDQLILHRLQKLIERVTAAYEEFTFYKVCSLFHNFCVVDLSKFYLDILKDRLYTYGLSSIERRAAQTVLYEILDTLVRLIAPILPFTAEEVWQSKIKNRKECEKSVHLSLMPKPNEALLNNELSLKWDELNSVRDEVLLALELARKDKFIGNSLEASVVIWTQDKRLRELLKKELHQLPSIFIVSQVSISQVKGMLKGKKVDVKIQRAAGKKCERCWIFSQEIGKNMDYPTLCPKCIGVIKRGDYGG
ncbi:MAG: isoleucine--tRNA ligase [bacterium]|nr:isoleucine--tRNA ligase [bacterium]